MKETKFYYNAEMLPYFDEGRAQFSKTTMISLEGITWAIKGNQLEVTITQEQEERWLFYLAFCIGVAYAKMAEKDKTIWDVCAYDTKGQLQLIQGNDEFKRIWHVASDWSQVKQFMEKRIRCSKETMQVLKNKYEATAGHYDPLREGGKS